MVKKLQKLKLKEEDVESTVEIEDAEIVDFEKDKELTLVCKILADTSILS